MPVFIGALIGALVQAAGTLVGRVLISLGIGYAVYSGVDASITWARDQAIWAIGAAGGNTVRVAAAMKVGVCISMRTSALLARLTIKGLTGGVKNRMVVK